MGAVMLVGAIVGALVGAAIGTTIGFLISRLLVEKSLESVDGTRRGERPSVDWNLGIAGAILGVLAGVVVFHFLAISAITR